MQKQLEYQLSRLKEKLWVRPLLFCIISIGVALLAHFADTTDLDKIVPNVKRESITELLTTISASMLVIAIFAVGSMVSAYNAASSSATPRSFSLIIADDVSKNALSVFIGSFIYAIVGTVALQNSYYGKAGKFVLLIITLLIFALVITTFLRWMQRIARLGRLEHTIEKIETAAAGAITKYKGDPYKGGVAVIVEAGHGVAVMSTETGYIQLINTDRLQVLANEIEVIIVVQHLPGKFITTHEPLVKIKGLKTNMNEKQKKQINKAFTIKNTRYFDDDPRFGLIALTEVASRALSPAVNDPGTAIAILGNHVRLFSLFYQPVKNLPHEKPPCSRIEMPLLLQDDFFDDAFRPIARDGAGNIEVMVRFQKALQLIAAGGDDECKRLANHHAQQAFKRAELALVLPDDVETLRKVCAF